MLWPLLVLTVVQSPAGSSVALDTHSEFRRIAGRPLWPGFEPLSTPIEVFDGRQTFLFAHPHPPEGFRPVDGASGTFVYDGRHESVRANTGVAVNGIETATADLSVERPRAASAALLVHEAFHVYQRKAHPTWVGNEADLFTYPFDDSIALASRRLETRAWVRALSNSDSARAWARTALAQRTARFERLPGAAAAYERGTELNEGLAQFVEFKSIGRAPALTSPDFPAEDVRARSYATGQAIAALLDRFAPGWESAMDTTALDIVLRNRLGAGEQASFRAEEIAAEQTRARADVEALLETPRRKEKEFREAPGWSVQVVAGKEPLWPQGFDPLNVRVVGKGDVLHTRWIKLGNGSGTCEVLGRASLTEAAGEHPLFQGVRQLVVTGLKKPTIGESAGRITIESEGIKASFAGTIERSRESVIVRVP